MHANGKEMLSGFLNMEINFELNRSRIFYSNKIKAINGFLLVDFLDLNQWRQSR